MKYTIVGLKNNSSPLKEYEMKGPNLFGYATSELSQDAFISWLLAWGKEEYKSIDEELNKCGVKLIQELIAKHFSEKNILISSVDVKTQHKNIDILCIVNNEFAILIEDKVDTKEHSNQLSRYIDIVKNDYPDLNLVPIYFKTQEQSNYYDIDKAGYKVFSRIDFLDVMNSYDGNNAILRDYRQYLQSIHDDINSYKTLPISEWNWHSWKGFYLELQQHLDIVGWDYVANPNGGFLGCWWHFQGNQDCEQYLQLEQKKLCFKIWVRNKEERRNFRNNWSTSIREHSKSWDLNLIKPARFGNGNYMTVCLFDGEYRSTDENGILDIKETVSTLKKCEELLNDVC